MCYVQGETIVTVNRPLNQEEFAKVGLLVGQPLGRHKEYADMYVLSLPAKKMPEALMAYLRAIDAPHTVKSTRNWQAGDCTAKAAAMADPDDSVPGETAAAAWIDSRGLDAETVANVAHRFDVEFWLNHKGSQNHSVTEYFAFMYEVCRSFQRFYAWKDWKADGDYWQQIDWFVGAVKENAAAAAEFHSWDADNILRIINGTSRMGR